MTIIVEDGTVVSGANSYVTVAELEAYGTARGLPITSSQEVVLIKAMDWIEEQLYKGDKLLCDQVLEWPRVNVILRPYCFVESNEIPTALKQFQMSVAIGINEGFDPTGYRERAALSEDNCGGGRIEYMTGSLDAYQPNPKMHKFIELLRPKNRSLRI